MRRFRRIGLARICVTMCVCTCTLLLTPHCLGQTRRTATEIASTALFNGRDLQGWSSWLVDSGTSDPRGVFRVEQGELRISGDGLGYLATRNTYRDYHLSVEFRWGHRNYGDRVGKARDSGIFLHAQGRDGNSADGGGAFMAAIECQIMEGAMGDLMLIRGQDENHHPILLRLRATVSGALDREGWPFFADGGQPFRLHGWGRINRQEKRRDWHDTFGLQDPSSRESATGQWNRLECVCLRDEIEVRLNGRRVNAASDITPRGGKILLQCEGSEIFFRRVDLRHLPTDQ